MCEHHYWWWRCNWWPEDFTQDVKRHKKACHLSVLAFFFWAFSVCRVWSSVSTHYSVNPPAEPSASDHLPAAAAASAPPSVRLTHCKLTCINRQKPNQRLWMIQILCAVCASATWAVHYLQSDSAALISVCQVVFAWGQSGGGAVRGRFREVDQVRLSIGMDQNVIR